MTLISSLLAQALERRKDLLKKLQTENTDAYRIFNGIAEGLPGLTIDRYASLILVQTFREALDSTNLSILEQALRSQLSIDFKFAYNHRGKRATESFDEWHRPAPEALVEIECQELGSRFFVRARHQGIDPWLFLDLRAGRRWIREAARGASVLNLFSYTCSVGISAAAAGAKEVWNVDFSHSSLEVGRRNAMLNQISDAQFKTIEEDCLPVLRQLAGLPAGGRRGQKLTYQRLEPRVFDIVVLDPPAWSKGKFGAVDVEGDYASLFKPAVLATKPGGRILATNHVASVDLNAWIESLYRCATKAGRSLSKVEVLQPDVDFPAFDGRPPLKIVVCHP